MPERKKEEQKLKSAENFFVRQHLIGSTRGFFVPRVSSLSLLSKRFFSRRGVQKRKVNLARVKSGETRARKLKKRRRGGWRALAQAADKNYYRCW